MLVSGLAGWPAFHRLPPLHEYFVRYPIVSESLLAEGREAHQGREAGRGVGGLSLPQRQDDKKKKNLEGKKLTEY